MIVLNIFIFIFILQNIYAHHQFETITINFNFDNAIRKCTEKGTGFKLLELEDPSVVSAFWNNYAPSLASDVYWIGIAQNSDDNLAAQKWISGGSVDLVGKGPNGSDLAFSANHVVEECFRLVIPSKSILDVGCSTARQSICMKIHGCQVAGILCSVSFLVF